jgi:DNA-binding CsgD family transcriptional regulator
MPPTRPQNFFYSFGGTVRKDDSVISYLTALRSRQAGAFGEREMAIVRYLMPHLDCALRVHSRISSLEERLSASANALDCFPWAVVLIDAGRKPILLNRAARTIVERADGLTLTSEGFSASLPSVTEALRNILESAICWRSRPSPSANGGAGGGTLAVARPSGARPYEILVVPLPAATPLAHAPSAVAAMFISDPEDQRAMDLGTLRNLYGFTAAEARLAAALLEGKTVEAAAAEFRISTNTARMHLKHILSKTQTSRQTELVRLLMNSPARLRAVASERRTNGS